MGQRRRPPQRWVAHLEVDVEQARADALADSLARGDGAATEIEAGTRVRVEEIDCVRCGRSLARCTGGDPDVECTWRPTR